MNTLSLQSDLYQALKDRYRPRVRSRGQPKTKLFQNKKLEKISEYLTTRNSTNEFQKIGRAHV